MRWAAATCIPRGSTLTTTGGVLQPLPSIPTTCLVLHTSDKSKTLQSDGDTFKSLSYFLQNFHWSPSLCNVGASPILLCILSSKLPRCGIKSINLCILGRTRVKFAIHRLLSIMFNKFQPSFCRCLSEVLRLCDRWGWKRRHWDGLSPHGQMASTRAREHPWTPPHGPLISSKTPKII